MILFGKLFSTLWLLFFSLLLLLLPRYWAIAWWAGSIVILVIYAWMNTRKRVLPGTLAEREQLDGTVFPPLSATAEISAVLEKRCLLFGQMKQPLLSYSSAIQLLPILGILLSLIAMSVANGQVIAAISMIFGVVNLLIFLPVVLCVDRIIRNLGKRLEKRKNELLRQNPRRQYSSNTLQVLYPDPREAQIALELAKYLQVDFMLLPEDSWSVAAGKHFFSAWVNLQKIITFPLKDYSFGELVKIRSQLTMLPMTLPDVLPEAAAPPPWSEFLKKNYQPGQYRRLNDRKGYDFWRNRPGLDAPEFVRYWSTRREAETALIMLNLAQQTFCRPELHMVYPNDPLGLYVCWASDSLEDVEFIIALEQEFAITISDGDAEKFFGSFTVQDAVRYLIEKQETAKTHE